MKATSSLTRNARAPMIALITLSLLNLLNYVDRYVVSSLVPFLEKSIDQGGLALTHAQSGWLYSAFIVVYMSASLPCTSWNSPIAWPNCLRWWT